MRSFILAALLAAPVTAQNPAAICQSAFDTPTYVVGTSMGGPNLLLAIKLTAASTYTATRIEMFTGAGRGQNSVAIWTHDALGDRPLISLGQGVWEMSNIRGWQGGNLASPVALTQGQVFWLVWGPANGSQASMETLSGPGSQPYRGSFDGGLTWNGPFQSEQWKFRIWCGSTGHYEVYGTACAGATRTMPELGWDGLPTVFGGGNTILLDRAVANDFALLIIGDSNATWNGSALPFDLASFGAPGCLIQASVGASLLAFTDPTGQAAVTLSIPLNGNLIGVRFYNQWFVHDAAANALGFKVSNAGQGEIGF